ncbi:MULTISPECIES: YoaK family protein [Stenotrophomonas]|uniref:YoaK family protein n=1 Tax=Stenotrophomonas TaxID=40323 RepID=UPI00087294BB|nr:YoaK family protein [Stenotrophomonas sp. BIIR7]OEZ02431.1 hypothetical protein BIY45_01110 [Stenotrophomonas sp. BIIR7]
MGIDVPRIVWVGTGLLAFAAGVVNAVGYLGYEHQAFSHMTGTVSLQSIALEGSNWGAAQQLLAVVAGFVAGSFGAGMLLRDRSLSAAYVALLAAEAALFAVAAALLAGGNASGACLAAAGCGMQNAMTSFYSGSAIRTTHLTGFFTDFGLVLGQVCRGNPAPRRRLGMWGLVLLGFSTGGMVAAIAFHHLGFLTLLLPSATAALCGFGLWLHLHRAKLRQ